MQDLSNDRSLIPAIGATVMTVVLASIYWVSRIGFPTPLEPVAWAVGVSLFHVSVPYVATRAFARSTSQSMWTSEPILALGCVLVTMVAGVVAFHSGIS